MPSVTRPNNSIIKHTIHSASVISFEKRLDQKVWYLIQIQPQTHKPYVISRKHEDFAQLSLSLHERFNKRAGSRLLPPKIKSRLNILPVSKQLHIQRAEEINQFLSLLFQTQSIVTESYMVLEFFGVQKSDDEDKENVPDPNMSRWKRLRCTSFLARSPPSSTALSSLCSQAANKIMPSWRSHSSTNPQPSISTPTTTRYRSDSKEGLKKSKSTTSVGHHPLQESPNSSVASSTIVPSPSSSSQLKSTIKIKVIYDVDNIIVIQVPRNITLVELRSRIAQKFSDPCMGGVRIQSQVVLLFNDSMSSCCSVSSNHMALPAVLINKEHDLTQIMHTKWNRLEKVTLRCIM
jgi:hypothetical protein